MKILGDKNGAVYLENLAGAVAAIIGAESGIIQHNRAVRHTERQCITAHRRRLIMIAGAVISGHQQHLDFSGEIQFRPSLDSIC